MITDDTELSLNTPLCVKSKDPNHKIFNDLEVLNEDIMVKATGILASNERIPTANTIIPDRQP